MGDSRHEVFAKFIGNTFPVTRYPTVLCVADGKMDLVKELRSRGYTVTVYEPNPRVVSHSRRFRKEVDIKRRTFTRDTAIYPKPSFIVGMHPDEATVEIMKWASFNQVPFAVVPCCVKGDINYTRCSPSSKEWLRRLRTIIHCEMDQLPITGKNKVLFAVGM